MPIDKNVGFIPIKRLVVIDKDDSQSRVWAGKIMINEDLSGHGIEKGDLQLNPNSTDFSGGKKSATFEEVEEFKKRNGRLPVFSDYTQIHKYECWEIDKEDNCYVDLKRIDEKYSASKVRDIMNNCIQETEERLGQINDYRMEAIVHENRHIALEDETPGLRQLTETSYIILEKANIEHNKKPMPERTVVLGNHLIHSGSRVMYIHETTAIAAEHDRAELDQKHQRYGQALRITELLSRWVRGNYTAGIYMQNEYKIDSHDVATLALMFGDQVVDPKCESLINFEKVAEHSSKAQEYRNKRISLESAVLVALLEKAEQMMQGKSIFVDKGERDRIVDSLKPLLPGEIAKTNMVLKQFAQSLIDTKEIEVLAVETLKSTEEIDRLIGVSLEDN